MEFEQTPDGLTIESLQEIIAGFEEDFKDPDPNVGWGPDAQVAPNTGFGQLIGIVSERIALLQQLVQDIQSSFDADEAVGADLDTLSQLTATVRKGADQSLSTAGQINGVDTTVVPDLSRVRNVGTSDIWEIVNGPYVIPPAGLIACTLRAQEAGAREFSVGTTWEIIDSVPGWDTFETTSDIDPEDIGRLVETDEDLRQRRKDELFAGGNDISGIKAQVSKVVDEVAVYENRDSCNFSPDGIPPGAIETVVEGGDDQEIIDAIYSRKPPGTEAFGQTVNGFALDPEGNQVPIGFTRVADVDIWVAVIVGVGSAEGAMPDNAATLIADAILEFGNANAGIGQDVVPETFGQAIWPVLLDPNSGKYAAETLDIEVGLTASTANAPIAIDLRSRPDYDSGRISVAVP